MAPGSLCAAPRAATASAVAAATRGVSGSSRCGACSPRQFLSRPAPSRRQALATVAAASTEAATSTSTSSGAGDGDRFSAEDFQNLMRGYRSQHGERSCWLEESMVEGTIPAELEGTLLRNGPGLFEVGGMKIPQPFDGDGMIALFAFKGGRAFFANRYVRTAGFVAEQQAQRLLFRGAFSVGNPSGGLPFISYNPFDLSVKGIANTGVVHWGGKLLALYERDLPYELSTPDLRTRGQTVSVPSEDQYFGAHYRVMKEADGRRRLVAFNAAERGNSNVVNIFEYDETMQLLHSVTCDLPDAAFGFFHDCLLTQNHYILLESPMSLDLQKMGSKYLWGKACIAECIQYDGARKRTKVHLIPRPTSRADAAAAAAGRRVFETEPFFSFHHANAFEDAASGRVVIDTVANHDGIDFSANFEPGISYYDSNEGRGTLTRLVVDTAAGTVTQHRLMDRACEFPSVAPAVTGQPHTHVYMVGSRFPGADAWGAPQAVVKVSLPAEAGTSQSCSKEAVQQDVYFPGRQCYAQEPIFVPRPGGVAEDDGWVLALVFDGALERSQLVILDAQRLSAGPVATIKLPHMLPMGLHGSWTGSYLGPPPGEERAPTEYDIRSGVTLEH